MCMRGSSSDSISDSRCGRDLVTVRKGEDLDDLEATFSSTKVFHSPHVGQRPSHLGDSVPQLLQYHTVFILFAIVEEFYG